jgi:hypothetical protein
MFMDRFGLRDYDDDKSPAVFFGCYNGNELKAIRQHRSLAVVVWLGGDFPLNGTRKLFKNETNRIKHVAIGKFLEDDLKAQGLPYRRVNLIGSPIIDSLRPEAIGKAVYYYYHDHSKENYGYDVFRQVLKELEPKGVEFIVQNGIELKQTDMLDIYRKCAIGLRLTAHDGGSETVIEMGLMGRPCIYNGDVPNAIPWDDPTTIAECILRWIAREGETHEDMAEAVHEHVQWSDDWLDVDEWSAVA